MTSVSSIAELRPVSPFHVALPVATEEEGAMSIKGGIVGVRSPIPMQPSDAFFWYAEAATPELRPLVAGLFLLDRAPDPRRFRAAMEHLTVALPRLRQRVIEPPLGVGLPTWRDDQEFDLDYHLREIVLPEPTSLRHLMQFAGEVFSAPLDHLRPLWEAQLVGGLDGGRAALFMKLHHAVMDGVGANALFDALTQARRADSLRAAHLPVRPNGTATAAMPAAQLVRRGAAIASAAARACADPAESFRQIARFARGVSALIADVAAPNASPANGHSLGIGRRLDGVVLSLPRMRRIKARLGVTLNDLVLTAVSGAVGRYHARHDRAVDTISCMVPVSLRQDHERADLGNRVGAFPVQLPIGERDPLARLARIREQTQAAKRGGSGAAYQLLMQASALIPAAVFRGVAHAIGGRTPLICSNVPGPPAARYLAGAKIDAVYPFAPVMFGTPMAIALVSYGTTYGVGIAADPAVIPDPERVGRYLEQALDDIERRVAQAAPGRPTRRGARKTSPHRR
jgi:WS/DGAT/MGAT family acyltransferase